MNLPDMRKTFAVLEATWPASAKLALGPWTIRIDDSNSSRVRATTAEGPISEPDIDAAEHAMQQVGQTPLFMIRAGDDMLNAALSARGYRIKDPVNIYAASVAAIATDRPKAATSFEVWPPLAAQNEVWDAGGIGAGRRAVMLRAGGPKTTLMGRCDDTPCAAMFMAVAADCAMVHALEVLPDFRRRGVGRNLMRAAAFWAQDQGATSLCLITTKENLGANALYSAMGFSHVGGYHYRVRPQQGERLASHVV